MQDFRKLQVWNKAHAMVLQVYEIAGLFPNEEKYGLTSQMRRSAMSIPTNIAEGCGRGSSLDMRRFLHIAMGSACELEYQLLLASDLKYLASEKQQIANEAITEIKRMLTSLIKKLKTDD